MKILVVDDDPMNLKLLQAFLEASGYVVEPALSGHECLRKFKNAMDDYGLIFLDIMMPGIDGIEVAKHIRRKSDIPIYAVTAHNRKSVRQQCTEAGMDGFFTKPIDRKAIIDLLGDLIFKINCPSCHSLYNILSAKIPEGRKASVTCINCDAQIGIDGETGATWAIA